MSFPANNSNMPACLSSRNKDCLGDECHLTPNSSCSYPVTAFLSHVISLNGTSTLFETFSHASICFWVWNRRTRRLPPELRRNFFPVIWNLPLIVVSRHRVYSSSLSSMTSWPFQLPMQSIYIWCFPGGIALYLFFWVTASHSLVDGHHSIRGTHCPHFRVYFWWRAPNIIINVLPPSWNATPKSEATHVVLPTVTSQYVQTGSTDEC